MSIEREYDGKKYFLNNRKWVDRDNMVVPVYLQNILNTLHFNECDGEDMSYADALREGDRNKVSESYSLAVKYYEQAVKQASSERELSIILPRVTSCYRKMGRPEKVISLLSNAKAKYGEGILNQALLTSVAAAYCDLGAPESALRCCRWAYKKLKDKTDGYSTELANVFARAKRMLDPDYNVLDELDELEYNELYYHNYKDSDS